jgi:hypothetical protein
LTGFCTATQVVGGDRVIFMTNDEVIKPVIERMHEQLEPLQADELE